MLRKNPDARVECTDVVDAGDEEVELPTRALVPIANAPVGESLDPFYYTVALDAFDAPQRVANERDSPGDRLPNVGTQCISVNARRGVSQRWNCQSAERAPEQRRRRDQTACEVFRAVRQPQLGSEQHRCATAEAACQEEIEPRAVGARYARSPVPA